MPEPLREGSTTDLQAAVVQDHPTCDDLLDSYTTCADFERAYPNTTIGDTYDGRIR
jgi:hypothetical protein